LETTTILVTGASGFLGRHLVKKLKQMRLRVIATDLFPTSETILMDVRDKAGVDDIFRTYTPQIVVHLAARVGNGPSLKQPHEFYIGNTLGTLNICDAATRFGTRKMVYISTTSAYRNNSYAILPVTEEIASRPVTAYEVSKTCAEMIVEEYARRKNLTAIVLRLTTIYGPEQTHSNEIQDFIDRALNSLPIELYGDGGHTREFLFVEDAADAIIAAINANVHGYERIIISTGEPVRLSELAGKICSMIDGATVCNVEVPERLFSQRYDISRARTMLEWRPRVPLEKGLVLTLEWRRSLRK
jgi:UDP-glucose 4-epimerase